MLKKIFTTVKYTLAMVNFGLIITGIITLAVGCSIQTAYNIYHPFLEDRFFSLPAFLIATGIIIFLVAVLGFYGVFFENYYVIMAYVGALAVILIFQFSAMIAGYALRGNTIAIVKMTLLDSMSMYGINIEVTKLWDEVQEEFECCGVDRPNEWLERLVLPEDREPAIPMSCCPYVYGSVTQMRCDLDSETIFRTGCGQVFGEWVQAHARSIGIAGVFLVLLQGLTVGGAIWIAKMSRTTDIYKKK